VQASQFNVRVPLPERGEMFLMNTLTDAQLLVSDEVVSLLDGLSERHGGHDPLDALTDEERETVDELVANGFIVSDGDADRHALDSFFETVREDTSELRVTVLTTLQCNFACDYCFQGDHGDYNKFAHKMTLADAARVVAWIEGRLDALKSSKCSVTFFGGEPLLNLPVMYEIAERVWELTQARGVRMIVNIITNGLLLTPDVVDRMAPFGLNGVKITLDGDRPMHDRMRPLRGGQGTFDRIIDNIRRVADKCHVSIGGNFDESSWESYPALLDFLKEQPFADRLAKVAFKPIIRPAQAAAPAPAATRAGIIPLMAVGADGKPPKPLAGTCMTSAGAGGTSPCDTCHFVDERMGYLREETRKRGFPTVDGVHMGPCEIHKRHAYTIGPDGSLYACPGFTGEPSLSTGHIDGRDDSRRARAAGEFEKLAAWKSCGDCSFIPVCAGGCTVASQTELGDMHAPTCHKPGFEAALVTLARQAAAAA